MRFSENRSGDIRFSIAGLENIDKRYYYASSIIEAHKHTQSAMLTSTDVGNGLIVRIFVDENLYMVNARMVRCDTIIPVEAPYNDRI